MHTLAQINRLMVIAGLLSALALAHLRDRYERRGCKQWATDLPSAVTSIRTNGRSKSVRHCYGCLGVDGLAELGKLERAIDEAVTSEQWIQ